MSGTLSAAKKTKQHPQNTNNNKQTKYKTKTKKQNKPTNQKPKQTNNNTPNKQETKTKAAKAEKMSQRVKLVRKCLVTPTNVK